MDSALAFDYIGSNKDWEKFSSHVSDNTGKQFRKLWEDNARANKPLIEKWGWATDFQDSMKGKTAVLLGASPAIEQQLYDLKQLRDDPDFVFIGISSGLEILLEHGIKPHYVMVADAEYEGERFWKNIEPEETKDMTLISNICSAPNVLKRWKGDIRFLAIWTAIEKLDRKFRKWFRPVNGIGHYFPALMSQYNTGFAFGFLILNCLITIFVGNELGFENSEATYYANREDKQKDSRYRGEHIDIYGNVYYTNHVLMALKLILEDFLGKMSGAGWFFNCTEAGIFGVSMNYQRKHGTIYLPWIQQLTLKAGIAQARNIMRTGQPFYMT